MARVYSWFRVLSIVLGGCVFAASGCLADNFWSALLGDTVIAGATAIIVDTVVTGVLPQ